MLKAYLQEGRIEAGCDEAGRGCLAGPVFAAAVILPPDFEDERINDSKKLTAQQRDEARQIVEENALAWAVAQFSPAEIDEHNIFRSSYLAMHRAIDALTIKPEFLLIDGKYFIEHSDIGHCCVIKGDGKYMSIAAAGILAKTHRDEYMRNLHQQYPHYQWITNQGYPTKAHREAIRKHGPSIHHRQSFRLLPNDEQGSLF